MTQITQRKELEASLRKLNFALKQIESQKLGNNQKDIAHQLRHEAEVIFGVIHSLGAGLGLETLYEKLNEGCYACERTLELSKLSNDLRDIISSILNNFRDGMAELNVLINLKLFEHNQIQQEKLSTLEATLEKTLKEADDKKSDVDAYMNEAHTLLKNSYDIQSSILEDTASFKENLATTLKESQDKIYASTQQQLNSIKEETKSFHNELSKITERIQSECASIGSNSIEEIKYNLASLEQESIERINSQSSKRLEALKEVQNGALRKFNNAIDEQVDSISTRINNEVIQFETKRSDMDDLLEKVGLAKDADVTISQANTEEEIANKLRNWGLIAMYASIVILVVLFSEYLGFTFLSDTPKTLGDLTFEAFAIRFMTVLLLSSPAMYMLKESASHRAKENLYRQRGTQLLTIRGYLADLSDTQRAEVKHRLAENFFSFHNGKADTSNVPDFIKNMNEAIKMAQAINPQQNEPKKKKEQAPTEAV